ncbi:hypothetical protein O0235_05395 [Tepidiforma flava]|uniref:Uncharacterized protein n=1 Tax=Tepidiforma flava TaxID=3004094 RepID=A0ABY7MBN0_9CHLR|nr:hypothetical protein [Tepidiforma flava]WBL37001.1 hypothetical protein O0235_05395 [Tepidiforma flava]
MPREEPHELLCRALTGPSSTAPGRSEKTRLAMSSDHAWNRSRSSPSTPSTAAITSAGSGRANSAERSTGPSAAASAASRSSAIARMRASSPLTARGVNAAASGSRSRVCAGGSRKFSHACSISTARWNAAERPCAARSNVSIRSDESRSPSRNPAATSACESTAHARWRALHCTSPASSARAK